MKKLIVLIVISLSANAEIHITPEMMYGSVGNAITAGTEGIAQGARYITNTQTEKEKCNQKWWVYFKESNHIIGQTEKENREMKILLQKNHIDYQTVITHRVRNINIDQNKLKNKSCSQEYFEQLVRNEKRIKEVKLENLVLKEMMDSNGIKNKKIIFNNSTKKERPKLKIEVFEANKIELQEAINDIK